MTAPKEVKIWHITNMPSEAGSEFVSKRAYDTEVQALKAESEKKDLKIEALQENNKALSRLNNRLSKSYNFDQANISDLKADLEALVKVYSQKIQGHPTMGNLAREIGDKRGIKYE